MPLANNFRTKSGLGYLGSYERSGSERVNGRLKDEFGGRHVRVRGYDKVLAHLMFGMTVLTASQLMRLIVPPI